MRRSVRRLICDSVEELYGANSVQALAANQYKLASGVTPQPVGAV